MYYVEKENEIVLYDTDKTRLEQTINFMPQYAGLEIKETDRMAALIKEMKKLGYVLNETDGSILSWNGRTSGGQAVPRRITVFFPFYARTAQSILQLPLYKSRRILYNNVEAVVFPWPGALPHIIPRRLRMKPTIPERNRDLRRYVRWHRFLRLAGYLLWLGVFLLGALSYRRWLADR